MNYKANYIRLFKVDYSVIQKEEATNLCEKIKETVVLWGPFLYELKENSKYLDILYVSKHASYYIQENLLDKYHLWIIKADEGGGPDFISGYSKYYKNNMKLSDMGFWECHEYCFYQADEIRICGKSEKMLEELKIFYPDYYRTHFKLTKNFEFIKSENIVYQSSNSRLCIDNFGNQKDTIPFNLSDHLYNEGELINPIGFDSIKLFDQLGSYPAKNFKDIFSVNFSYKNKVVLQSELIGNSTNNLHWKIRTNDNYYNCINTNFVRFEVAYNYGKIY